MSGAIDRIRQFLFYQAPVIVYAALIYFMSSLPSSELPELPFLNGDKLVHALEYGLFGILLFRAFRFPISNPNPYRMTLAFGILYAASDEIHQFFTPGRSCTVSDFIADVIGIAFFAWISLRNHPVPPAPPSLDPRSNTIR